MRVADYIAKFLKKQKIKDLFMLTGYGAMYLNDAIKLAGIKYYATRNEATAPIMASAYSKIKNQVSVACVTAGPGATNALPGLAEAFVDSSPVVVLSGQVDYKQTTYSTNSKSIRTFGTAEINILPIVKPLTKYSEIVKNPEDIRYILEKAFYVAKTGRKGPVWIDVPLNVQKSKIKENNLKKFNIPKIKKINNRKIYFDIDKILHYLNKSKKPILVVGNGIKQSETDIEIKSIVKKLKIPVFFTRFTNDLISHDKKYIFGLGGIKATKYGKKIMTDSDLVISLGCRFSPQFVGHEFQAFKKAKVISVDIDKDEMFKKGQKIDLKLNYDLKKFIPILKKKIKTKKIKLFNNWVKHCEMLKKNNPMVNEKQKKTNPIDLYFFMERLGILSKKNSILITDAGSNYYIGGQVWNFLKGQREVSSYTNAAMGLTIPLSVGAAIASKNSSILGVTGDGSLELNIQELKTISHYKLNIKIFVINNGGYVSMHNWADNFFKGRRLDTPEDTGDGTLNLKNVAKAFDLEYFCINNYKLIDKSLKYLLKKNKPMFIEVVTDDRQKIYDAYKDH
jgi:acetolactate synthase I/II/III large subunit